jgi:hypothetical protein
MICRTLMIENRASDKNTPSKGRDLYVDAFTMFMAGAGIKKGYLHGETDETGYYDIKSKTHIYDLKARIMHISGFDHEKFNYPFQGRNFRLKDVNGKVIRENL